eukprot:jgi/Tetstr1/460506/TSEL_005765.t1
MAVAVEMHDALEGQAAHWRSPGIAGKLHNRVGGQIVATSLFNLAFCLAVAAWPMRVNGTAWNVMYVAMGTAAWSAIFYFLWQKRESTDRRFQAFVLQQGYVYSRMIEIYIWTWIGILYCLYLAGLTLATLPLHIDSGTLPGSRCYMWVLNFFLSFPHLLAFDPVSSTQAFKEAAVRKGYPGAVYFHHSFMPRTGLLVAIVVIFPVLWMFGCGPVGLFSQADYDFYALYAITALNVLLMFRLLPRYANMCKSVDALTHPEARRLEGQLPRRSASGFAAAGRDQGELGRALPRPPPHTSSRVNGVVLAALSTPLAWEKDAMEASIQSIGAGSFRRGQRNGRRLWSGSGPGRGGGGGGRGELGSSREHLMLPGEVHSEKNQHTATWAFGKILGPLVTVMWGLWDLPRGAVMLVLNVTASVKHIWCTWRWLAATRPEKFHLAVGYLIGGLLLWPVLELKCTENVASMLCNGLAFFVTLCVDLAMLSGHFSVADQEMIFRAAEEGESVGSGLVFSTASLLHALAGGGPLAAGYVATEERLVESAAISCRWDTGASWMLTVEQTGGRAALQCAIMFSRQQLHRAALLAWRNRCKYMWIDTLSVPQPSPTDDPRLAARKTALLRRLVPTMTSVYATVQHVIIVETQCGLESGSNCYSGRTWTLQECVINRHTAVVHLDGRQSILGAPAERVAYTGLDPTFNTADLDNLGSYRWVLSGEEHGAALSTTPAQRAAFQGFVNTRSAARSADKAVALGQIFFRMLFEHAGVATRFMHEVAVLLAQQAGPPLLLIDNRGWDPASMSGSADAGRVLLGRPGRLEHGDRAVWTLRRVRPEGAPHSGTGEQQPGVDITWSGLRADGEGPSETVCPPGAPQSGVAMPPGRVDDETAVAGSACSFGAKTRIVRPNEQPVMLKPERSHRAAASAPTSPVGKDAFTLHGSGAAHHDAHQRPEDREWAQPIALDTMDNEGEWWLCKLSMRRAVVAVAIKPGAIDFGGPQPTGYLHQMRTCTEGEKARLEGSELEKLTVSWL